MTSATPTPETTNEQNGSHKGRMMSALQANEWGQLTGLEPHATYFVVRRPNVELSRERSNKLVDEFKGFLQEQRLVTEKQVQQFQEKYGEPAKAKAKELRTTFEKRFDELAKNVEERVIRIEQEIHERAPQVGQVLNRRKGERGTTAGGAGETPGEMPTGDAQPAAQAEASASADTATDTASGAAAKKKSGGKKSE